MVMETPKYYEFMNPILRALRDKGGTLTNEEIVDAVVSLMKLPDEVLERKHQGHNLSEVEYRIAWAKSWELQGDARAIMHYKRIIARVSHLCPQLAVKTVMVEMVEVDVYWFKTV